MNDLFVSIDARDNTSIYQKKKEKERQYFDIFKIILIMIMLYGLFRKVINNACTTSKDYQ